MSVGVKERILKILLAEDNEVNRRLTETLLEKKGMHVVTAVDGFDAVRAFKKEPFDLVLMDVQMPNMDGLEATKRIRELEQAKGGTVPIVAMTAHTHENDRDQCFKAGMDAYLSKPVQAKRLYSLIDNCAKRIKPEEDGCGGDVLDLDKALEMVDGDRSLLEELAQDFLGGASEKFEELETVIRRRDSGLLEQKAHALKGDIGIFGARSAYDLAYQLETMGKEGRFDSATVTLTKLKAEIDRLKVYFSGSWKRNA